MSYSHPDNKTIEELLYDTCDNKDPISQTDIWIIENNEKKIVFPKENYNKIRFYYESDTILRCFEIDTLRFMKTYNISKHPISYKIIPEYIFNDIEIYNDNDIPISILASQVFNLLTDSYIYIEYKTFLELSKEQLCVLYNEFKSLWINNLTQSIRDEISNNILNIRNIYNYSLEELQRYLLNQIKFLLEYESNYKFMIINIIIASLSIVMVEVRNDYYDFDFNINNAF
jgi:hypothetical protein